MSLRFRVRFSAIVATFMIAAGTQPAHAQAAHDSGDAAAVRAVVQRYLHGLKFNDTVSFHEAFWPEAKLFYVTRTGEIGQWTQKSWYAGFAASAGKEEEGTLAIAALEVTRDIASVKVVEEYPKSRYTDYITLLKISGRWWIVNKVYTAERK